MISPRKLIKRLLIAFIAITLFVIIVLLWILFSTSGLRWTASKALPYIPQLTIQQIDGRAVGPVSLSGIKFETKTIELAIDNVQLDWDWLPLTRRTLLVDQLAITGVNLTLLPSTESKPAPQEATQPFQWQLPLAIIVNELVINNGTIQKEGNPPLFSLEQLLLAGVADNSKLQISTLDIESSLASANGQFTLFAEKQEASYGELNWVFNPQALKIDSFEKLAPIKATSLLTGNLEKLRLENIVETPYALSADITLFEPTIFESYEIDLAADNLVLNKINPSWPSESLTIRQQLKGTKTNIETSGYIEALSTRFMNEAAAEFGEQDAEWEFKTQWEQFQWPQLDPKIITNNGQISANGKGSNYQFNIATDLQAQETNGQLALQGSGSATEASLSKIKLTGPLGNIQGNADVKWSPKLTAKADLVGDKINPGILFTNWPGDINFNLTADSELRDNKPIIDAELVAEGKLREQPLYLNLIGEYQPEKISLDTLKTVLGDNTLTAEASLDTVNKNLNANWQLQADNLIHLWPDTSGQIISQGEFSGSTEKPRLKTTLKAKELRFYPHSVNALELDADIHWDMKTGKNISTDSEGRITVTASDIRSNSQSIDNLNIQLTGSPIAHLIDMNAIADVGTLETKIAGEWQAENQQWLYELQQALVDPVDLPAWKLLESTSGIVSATEQRIDSHCWGSEEARWCAEGQHTTEASKASFTLENLSTKYFTPLFPENFAWKDTLINGGGDIEYQSPKLIANIQISSSNGQLEWLQPPTDDDEPPEAMSVAVGAGFLNVKADDKKVTAALSFPIEEQKGFAANAELLNTTEDWLAKPLTGNLTLDLASISPFTHFIPDAYTAEGKLSGSWQAKGTIANPTIEGEIDLTDGTLGLTSPGLEISNITLSAKGNQQDGLNFNARADSGDGNIAVKGSAVLLNTGPSIALAVTGDNAQIFNTSEAMVNASPDLQLTIEDRLIDIKGNITIPSAQITPTELPKSVQTVSEDQIIVSDAQTAAGSPYRIRTDIELILSDDVLINSFGFKGYTTGTLRVTKDPTGPALGNGEIRILNGEYRALGQGLVVERGSILFTGGPVNKPGIDLKAYRRPAEDITVGLYARGTIRAPELTIYSEPAMGQQEQLSWLVLGRAPDQASEGENNALNQLLLSLSLSQGDDYLTSIRDTFKLDTFSIKTGTGEAGAASDNDMAELVLGKYLTPDLYVSYGIGLFQAVNVLTLEYTLGRRWKLTSETSVEASGGDLVYTVEK